MRSSTEPGAVDWTARAENAHASLERFYGIDRAGLPVNTIPRPRGPRPVLNYWWVANLIQARAAAASRPAGEHWLGSAETLYRALVARNRGLFNDYFDDMLWLSLAALDLYERTANRDYLDDGSRIWERVWQRAGGAVGGRRGIAWREQQLDYQNAPTNLLFIILSLRLDGLNGEDLRTVTARQIDEWFAETLVDRVAERGRTILRIADGINRVGDGSADWEWQFSYNYGLLIGAQLRWAQVTGDDSFVARAAETASDAIARFGDGSAYFPGENQPGDAGLFKGVLFRYLGELWSTLPADDDRRRAIEQFVSAATTALWRHHRADDGLLAGNDWSATPSRPFAYSAQISAAIATDLRARIESTHRE